MSELVNWVPDTDSFPVRLVLVRHRLGWNAKEAALACGIAAQSWREWEAGRRPRDYEQVCKQIVAHTHCDLMWLMAGEPRSNGDSGQQSSPLGISPDKPVGLLVSPSKLPGVSQARMVA